jgi:Arc/MetJ-type ribon-helix-helix transcriptional regulator
MTITLHGDVAEMVQKQVSIGSYQSAEDLVCEALELLIKHKIDVGINEGMADIKAGRSMKLRIDNIEEVLSKPISQW